MKIWSNSFKNEDIIPPRYTCDGENISPHLAWDDVPETAKSFALISDDPDAPGGNWVHWLVCDIAPDVREISENSVPENAKQVRNDFGKLDYGGPCPPSGTHRYFFKLYVLDVEALENASEHNFYKEVQNHKIAEANLMGKYKRSY